MWKTLNVIKYDIAKIADFIGNNVCQNVELPEFVKLVKQPPLNKSYDVVIAYRYQPLKICVMKPWVKSFFYTLKVLYSQCFFISSYYWKIPNVGVIISDLYLWVHSFIGNPENYPISSNNLYEMFSMDFTSIWTWLQNFYSSIYGKWTYS